MSASGDKIRRKTREEGDQEKIFVYKASKLNSNLMNKVCFVISRKQFGIMWLWGGGEGVVSVVRSSGYSGCT